MTIMTIINVIDKYKYIILSFIVIMLFFALVTQLFNTDFLELKKHLEQILQLPLIIYYTETSHITQIHLTRAIQILIHN